MTQTLEVLPTRAVQVLARRQSDVGQLLVAGVLSEDTVLRGLHYLRLCSAPIFNLRNLLNQAGILYALPTIRIQGTENRELVLNVLVLQLFVEWTLTVLRHGRAIAVSHGFFLKQVVHSLL